MRLALPRGYHIASDLNSQTSGILQLPVCTHRTYIRVGAQLRAAQHPILMSVIDRDRLPRLMGPFSVLLSLSVLSHVFGAVDKTSSSFSAHGKIGNFIIIIIIIYFISGDPISSAHGGMI